ncbi:hypothetical protein, conserved [Eimeria tenella]|uniref:Sas10 C-terminal domain-containing protein n=1 Tax=Eimeria tenella TaxID=5802 RepID=U6KVW8_EIMTE|nr:hypothetical protein, conserved [Eimeria tenella]CDJ41068.1 hypothetical protein, conserved [Eimeria tenella]|eukprot:XP_013231818.1 hypothetical protein, conserved [Eimeria tenella]
MARGKRGAGRRPAASSRSTAASRGASRGGAAASANAEYMSDSSEDFLPLSGGRKGEQDSEDETTMMQQMGFEDAEDTASDEDEEESTEGGSPESEEGSDDDDQDDVDASDDAAANSAPSSDEETRTAWGRKAKDFYDEGSDEESSEDEEELQERAAEAVRVTEVEEMEGVREEHFGADPRSIEALKKLLDMQGKSLPQQQKGADKKAAEGTEQEMLWQARLDAEVGAILDGFAVSTEQQQQQKPQAAAAGLSEDELKEIVNTAHPELEGLLQELRDSLKEINQKVEPLITLAKAKRFLTQEGVSLLDAKNQLLLSYLTYLAYYILLKAHGVPIATHPVLERLIETKLLLQKLRPIEAALKPQLQRLLSSAREGSHGSAAPRARPEAFAAVGESDGDESGDDNGDESASGSEASDVEGDETKLSPQMIEMEHIADNASASRRAARELQRAAARLKKSEMVRAVKEMTGDAPEEVGIERWLAAKAHKEAAREAGLVGDDEDMQLMRRSLSKKERKVQAAQRALFERRAALSVGSTLEDLSIFCEEELGGVGEDDDGPFDLQSRGKGKEKTRGRGMLSHYLNAAKQAAEENKKLNKAFAEKLVIARQQNLQHLNRKNHKEMDKSAPKKTTAGSEESEDEEFARLVEETKVRKEKKKQQMKEKAEQFLPESEPEFEGRRHVTKEIMANRGLVRKRKKYEGNARVHNRMKFERKTKKLKSLRPEMRAVEDRSYEGEVSGLRANLKRSRTLN